MTTFRKVLENYFKRKRQTFNLRLHVMKMQESHCDELAFLAPA